jgi:formamidopyrimidine-DNA glycosylase
MPEILEVERYRALVESRALGRPVVAVSADDGWYVKGFVPAASLESALVGRPLIGARRRGKLLLLDTGAPVAASLAGETPSISAGEGSTGSAGDVPGASGAEGPVLGLRFGMTGRLSVDGVASIDRLLYAPVAPDPRHDRFALRFADGGELRLHDPRRLGGVELDPDESRLGPDALQVTPAQLDRALRGGRGNQPVKARLLDQSRVAGIGNLLADELLWRAAISPLRPAGSLQGPDVRRLQRHLRATLAELGARGGSHTGDLMAQRRAGGLCPRDGAPLRADRVGGRTSWWCPTHQR